LEEKMISLIIFMTVLKCSSQSAIPEHQTGTTINSIQSEIAKHLSEVRNKITYCLHNASVIQCFKTELLSEMDKAINDNKPWELSDQIMVKKNPHYKNKLSAEDGRSFENAIKSKLTNLLESRIFQFQFPQEVDEAGMLRYLRCVNLK
jgi:hypothetical protein